MNKIEKFCKQGYIEVNVNYKPMLDASIICVVNGIWYKFNIDEIEQLEDNTYNIKSKTLKAVDNKLIK